MNPPDESNTAEPEEESLESSASGADGIAHPAESSPAALEAASTGGEAAAEESPAVTTSVDISPPRGQPFPIVGIGASAGGLEAVTQLLHALPGDTGMAFVLVQHLDPHHESQLINLLTPATPMRVCTVVDGMPIEPNRVYVIPPNTTMILEDGKLRLSPRKSGLHLPIDAFFESLAQAQGGKAIGIVLSGNASDGSRGIRAIKAECGVTFAQDEATARHSGMPGSAIATGAVDFVLPPDEIARELLRIARHPYVIPPSRRPEEEVLPEGDGDLKRIFKLLHGATNVDFSHYKQTTIRRRIGRRMLVLHLSELAEYARYIQHNPAELQELYRDLLINVTSFFRDAESFEALKRLMAAALRERKDADEAVRVWVPGCATGEEVYSLAICLSELLDEERLNLSLQLFGTDINEAALERARAGVYSETITEDVSPERLRRFFARVDSGYQISKQLRESCIFARQDLAKDPPFSHLDVISCRNVLIYMDAALQQRILPIFHYSLKPEGFLMLGSAESIGSAADLFSVADKQHRIYSRRPVPVRLTLDLSLEQHAGESAFPGPKVRAGLTGAELQRKADRIIQSKYSPASVLVNSQLQILQFRGHTSEYLEPTPGEASLNLLRMAREGLVLVLRRLIQAVAEQNVSMSETGIYVDHSGEQRQVNIEVTPIAGVAPGERYYLIVFQEGAKKSTAPPLQFNVGQRTGSLEDYTEALEEHARQLQQQLAETREYLRNLTEDHEAHAEELRAANEEVRSANEELQSTNEELSTTKEELQSANEELTTVNEELQHRNQELAALNSDLKNLFSAVSIPIVMVDNGLRLRRFNTPAEKLLELGPTDVGRPIGHLRGPLEPLPLEKLIVGVLETLKPEQQDVQDQNGRWHSVTVRPYRTTDDRIEGAVITIVDIDPIKRSLRAAEEARDYAEGMIETVREPLLVLDGDLRVQRATLAFYEMFQVSREETEGRLLYDLGNGQWNRQRLRELLGDALFRGIPFQDYEVEHDFPHIGRRTMYLSARRIPRLEARTVLLAIEDVTKRRQEAEIRYGRLFEASKDGILLIDVEAGSIMDINPYMLELTGYPREEFVGRRLNQTAPFREAPFSRQLMQELMGKDVVRYDDVPLIARDGRRLELQITANRYLVGTRQVIQMNVRDTTDRAALRESQRSFRLFVESVRDYAMFQMDPSGNITSWNAGAERILGYTETEILGQPLSRLFTREDTGRGEPERLLEKARTQKSAEDERWFSRKDGSRFLANAILTSVRDETDKLRGFAMVMRDTTRQRQAEERLRRSLQEKDVLLKEIHHRVKNNLQMIVSLIQLQSDYLRDPEAAAMFQEMHHRVQSIAAIHELLYGSPDLAHIDFGGYIQKLARDLFEFYRAHPDRIRLRTDMRYTGLELNQAVPVGLIVNELLSNCLKHAFPNERSGLVQVTLECGDSQCVLSVADNGVGLPANLDPAHATSMGLQLVRLLVEQLQGTLQLDRSQGTRFTISFPRKIQQ